MRTVEGGGPALSTGARSCSGVGSTGRSSNQLPASLLPAAGEIVLFDRSWYNRAVVERVMGFCKPAQHDEFMNQVQAYTDGLDQNMADRFFRLAAGMHRGSHPFTIERAKALHEWASSPELEQISAGNYGRLKSASSGSRDVCPKCHAAILSTYQFCAACGQGLKAA